MLTAVAAILLALAHGADDVGPDPLDGGSLSSSGEDDDFDRNWKAGGSGAGAEVDEEHHGAPADPLCLFSNPCKARSVIMVRG
jgi:hypothetical protein